LLRLVVWSDNHQEPAVKVSEILSKPVNENATTPSAAPGQGAVPENPVPGLDTELHPLDPRVVHYWRVHSLISSMVLLLLAAVGGLVAALRLPAAIPLVVAAWLGLLAVRIWLLAWYPPKAYGAWGYRLNNKVLETRHGVWFRTLTLLPLSRLQHVDLQRGPLERAFGLASLTLFTAGTQHASIALPGLDAEEAARLRDQLVAVGGDDAV
jgi:membrane protein YdbS with pleckstrin-like domain